MEKEYLLMHKDIVVCSMEISPSGEIAHIIRSEINKAHFPLGGQMNNAKFHDWWKDRAIPKSRHGVDTALERLGYSSTGNILVDNLALSLTDCYWIKPRGSDITWKQVNLFKNDFVDVFGELTMNEDANIVDLRKDTKFSPASSQGELQKKWCITNDKRRILIKGNYGQSYQQSLNEVFVSNLHEQLGSKLFTKYYLSRIKTSGEKEGIGCYSYNFCNEDVELISAWELLQTDKIKDGSYYFLLKSACLKYGMKEEDFDQYIDYMIMSDFLITNIDRHMNNIALLRNPDTLELIGFAPLYDMGNSMFYDCNYEQLKNIDVYNIKTHNFITWEIDLLKYVKNKHCLDLSKINPDFSIYDNDIKEGKNRYPLIKKLFFEKLEILKRFQNEEKINRKR